MLTPYGQQRLTFAKGRRILPEEVPMGSILAVIICVLAIVLSSVGYHAAQQKRMKRSKEILGRYDPERSKKPLGL